MKKLYGLCLAAGLASMMTFPAFAGQWVQDTQKAANAGGISNWWYQKDDGSYYKGDWFWIDGDGDGLGECYRFDENGWMYASTTVDNYTVDANGAWVENGVVPRKTMDSQKNTVSTSSQKSSSSNNSSSGTAKNQWIGMQYFNSKGEPTVGWKKISGKTYYFDDSGYALTGYQSDVEGNDYYFYSDGEMAKKTVHDTDEGVYYVLDKEEYYIVDIVDEDDWKEYKKEADKDSVETSKVTSVKNSSGSSGSSTEVREEEKSSGSSLTDEEAYKKLISLKKKYPEGKKWTNDNTYQRGYVIGGGCAGFAFIALDTVFGKNAPSSTYYDFEWEDLRVGDHIRMENSYGGEHSVIVLTIEDDYITICEGNYNSSIHWGRKITRDTLESKFIYRQTCYE